MSWFLLGKAILLSRLTIDGLVARDLISGNKNPCVPMPPSPDPKTCARRVVAPIGGGR